MSVFSEEFFLFGGGCGCFLFVLLITVQGIEPRALCTLSKCPTTELHAQPQITGLLASLCTFLASGQDSLREATGRGGGMEKKFKDS